MRISTHGRGVAGGDRVKVVVLFAARRAASRDPSSARRHAAANENNAQQRIVTPPTVRQRVSNRFGPAAPRPPFARVSAQRPSPAQTSGRRLHKYGMPVSEHQFQASRAPAMTSSTGDGTIDLWYSHVTSRHAAMLRSRKMSTLKECPRMGKKVCRGAGGWWGGRCAGREVQQEGRGRWVG